MILKWQSPRISARAVPRRRERLRWTKNRKDNAVHQRAGIKKGEKENCCRRVRCEDHRSKGPHQIFGGKEEGDPGSQAAPQASQVETAEDPGDHKAGIEKWNDSGRNRRPAPCRS